MVCSFDLGMDCGFQGGKNGILNKNCSKLLESAATDDLAAFIHEVKEKGCDVNEGSFWYGRSFGSKKMGFEERSPIMIASLYGSTEVLKYIIESCKVDVNKACGSDGATALHCAAAGGSWSSVEVVKLLIAASGDVNAVDADGKKPGDLIAPCVKNSASLMRKTLEILLNGGLIEGGGYEGKMGIMEKKEYPVDVCLPDINNGVYGSDEFRMYSFKVQPCSRAYSHDWTECPFVHPGENARRRDPRKYSYTCVPCPEFKKGSCGKGDGCEFAHGVFESWLHPAQYRTRLCKDEIGCSRKVCFFAHKPQELRPLYASTGSAIPSPKSVPLDSTMMSPLSLGSTPPMSPGWGSKTSCLTPPALHLPGSRLKSTLSARDFEMEMNLKPTNLDDFFGSLDPIRPNTSHLRASYPTNASYGFDSSAAVAAAMMNSRSSAFAKRSQSFVDRGGVGYRPGMSVSPNSPTPMMPSKLSNWGSPDGKLDWGFNGEDASKLRKSASFGFRTSPTRGVDEPDVSWVNSLVKDVPAQKKHGGVHEMMPLWVDQMYMEQEQMVA